MKKRRGFLLSLRLQGLGFHPADAETLAGMWEAGHTVEELLDRAIQLGYDLPPGLDEALSDLPRPGAGEG